MTDDKEDNFDPLKQEGEVYESRSHFLADVKKVRSAIFENMCRELIRTDVDVWGKNYDCKILAEIATNYHYALTLIENLDKAKTNEHVKDLRDRHNFYRKRLSDVLKKYKERVMNGKNERH